jgi:capsular polysaccharide biosynthesis protein
VGQGKLHAFLVVGAIAAALAGCVTASNTVSVDQIATYRLSGVNVTFAPDVIIMWGDGERAYAASKGQPATESDILAKTPEGQAYLRNTIATKLKGAMERNLAGGLIGARPVRLDVTVKNVTVASVVQRVIVGGHHQMTADVTLVDAKTGAVVVPYAAQSALALGGQGLYAVLDAAVMPDPLDRVVNNYAEQYGNWLLRK